jgi:hypothetical protein
MLIAGIVGLCAILSLVEVLFLAQARWRRR